MNRAKNNLLILALSIVAISLVNLTVTGCGNNDEEVLIIPFIFNELLKDLIAVCG